MSDKLHTAFERYISNFDLSNPLISSKIEHMGRVEKIIHFLANAMRLSKKLTEVAVIIGRLHDIGRLEQLTDYGTFNDYNSIDHAEAGGKYLFDEGHITDFVDDSTVINYGEIIEKAIRWHNKILLPKEADSLSYEGRLLCKLIRDADKIDIYNIYIKDTIPNRFTLKEGDNGLDVTKAVLDTFYEGKLIDAKLLHGWFDYYVMAMALVFDINFVESKKLLVQTRYLEKFTANFLKTPCGDVEEIVKMTNGVLGFALDYLMLSVIADCR